MVSDVRQGCGSKTRWTAGLCAAAAALAAVAPSGAGAAGGSTERADFSLDLASSAPATPTRARLKIVYRAAGGDPEAKPSPIRRVVIEAPPGTSFGLDRVPACEATDEELRMSGGAACRAPSRVGAGSLVAVTGFGAPFDPFPAVVTLFNTGKGFLELVEQEEPRATLAVDRAAVDGSTAVLMPPSTPGGPPDGQTAIREIDLHFDRPEYLTTPRSCPRDGLWRSRGVFTFADGVTVAVPATTPCSTEARRSALRVSVSPRRIRAGRRTRFRVKVRSADPSCRGRARVRLGHHRLRADRRGRAVVITRPRRAGRFSVAARRKGCLRGVTSVRVLPR